MHCLSIFLLCLLAIQTIGAYNCRQVERDALLEFKAGVHDRSGRLASWRGEECCTWAGIKCSNQSGHIIKLHLHDNNLSGENINPSLQALTDLKHLDLSFNNFSGSKFPKFICSFGKLKHLDLSSSSLSGMIPPAISNLSKLEYLDLNNYDIPITMEYFNPYSSMSLAISNIWCLSHLTSLKYIGLVGVNLYDSREWVQALNMLPSLESLQLRQNNLTTIPSSLSIVNFTSLSLFSIYGNDFNTRIPDWIGQLTNLGELDIIDCSFIGSIPDTFGNLSSLNTLTMYINYYLKGSVPSLRNLHNLTYLRLQNIDNNEDITTLVSKLSNNALEKLKGLVISYNNLTGNLTGWLDKMPNLIKLELSMNKLNGTIPAGICNLTNLIYLDLSGNSFTGEISEVHLTGLSKLDYLYLSSNLITITIDSNWVPPFQLYQLDLGACKLGPTFPSWLHNQFELTNLNLSYSGIHDSMPDWFWNLSSLNLIDLSHNQIRGRLPLRLEYFTQLGTMILSNNQFYGVIPPLPRSLETLDLSFNSFSGTLPQRFKAPYLSILILSNNFINGSIGRYICDLTYLEMLDLSRNNIYGELPYCWPNSLQVVNLANNKINGTIPSSINSLNMLSVLQLNNNSLTGLLPSVMQFCRNLNIIDLGENKFYGQIPEWLGETLPNLNILRLRSNSFHGNIPSQIVHLTNLQVLDLANNNFSGLIPQNMDKMMAMTSSNQDPERYSSYPKLYIDGNNYYTASMVLSIKGSELEYSTTLLFLKSIDLSENNLTGEIPQSITALLGIINLNLSNNNLKGTIPVEIGKMQQLESLDLRMNELSGIIPQSLAKMNFLSILNVSYNNLSGKIPTGHQLQTLLDPYIYIGNAYLCGSPLNKSCNTPETSYNYNFKDDDNNLDEILLYLFTVIGFGFGFWAFFSVLMFKRNWRYRFFRMVDDVFDRIYVFVMLYFARLMRYASK